VIPQKLDKRKRCVGEGNDGGDLPERGEDFVGEIEGWGARVGEGVD